MTGSQSGFASLLRSLASDGQRPSLAHHAPQSVLVAKTRFAEGPIVAGIADDAGSAYAAAWAAGLARWLGRTLILAHSVPGRTRMETLSAGPDGARFDLAAWPPDEGLIACAAEEHAPLLVVGHGHVPGWLGSTAIRTLRQAPMSVLVARPWKRHEGMPR